MLERYFRLAESGTTIRTEVVAGVTTFLTMAYIMFVNPAILGDGGLRRHLPRLGDRDAGHGALRHSSRTALQP